MLASSQHIALAIGEEVDLQTRLLDDLDEDVDVTQSRMKAATLKVREAAVEVEPSARLSAPLCRLPQCHCSTLAP